MANYDPVSLSLANTPRAIVRTMDDLNNRRDRAEERYRGRRWVPFALFFLGFPFVIADFALGFNCTTFSLVALGLWVAALLSFAALLRARPGKQFAPQYATAREVIHTLRDDLAPKSSLFGQVDLTGAQLPTKLTKEAPNPQGLDVQYYRDEWLGVKAKLYDGNMLRLSAIEWTKVRKGYFKTGTISGKQKWKEPKSKHGQELRVRLSVNPNVYEVRPSPEMQAGAQIGAYAISALDATGGIVNLSAVAPAVEIGAPDVLGVLHAAYGLLQRKAPAA